MGNEILTRLEDLSVELSALGDLLHALHVANVCGECHLRGDALNIPSRQLDKLNEELTTLIESAWRQRREKRQTADEGGAECTHTYHPKPGE